MSFCIAELELPRGRREVAVVHRRWINGENFYYPSFWRKRALLTQSLREGWSPEPEKWLMYKGHIVGNRFYDSFDVAESLLARAENGSDLSSAEDTVTRPSKRKPNKSPSWSAGSDDSEEESSRPKMSKPSSSMLPPPPPVQVNSSTAVTTGGCPTLIAVNYNNNMETTNTGVEPPARNANLGVNLLTQSTPEDTINFPALPLTYFVNDPATLFTPPASSSSESSIMMGASVPNPVNLRGMARSISTLQQGQLLITAKLDMCLDLLRTLIPSNNLPKALSGKKLNLPVTSMDQFDNLNVMVMNDKDAREALVGMLAVKGGNTANQVTYRVMGALLTNELMINFTMAGQKHGKRCFKETVLLQCVCDAVRKSSKGSVATDKEIEGAVEYWLKKAKARIDAHTRRTAKQIDQCGDGGRSDQEDV